MVLDKGQLHLETPWLEDSFPKAGGGMTQGQVAKKRFKQPLLPFFHLS